MSVTGSNSRADKSQLQEKIAAGSQELEDYLDLADLLVREDRYDEAVKLLESALNLSVSNIHKARGATELAWLIYNIDEPSKALPFTDRSLQFLSNEPESCEVNFLKGLNLSLIAQCLWLNDNQAANEAAITGLTLFERIIAQTPDFDRITVVQLEAARVCNLLGKTERSIHLCAKCLEQSLTDEHRLSCLVIYGEALRVTGQFEKSEGVLKEALNIVKIDERMLPRIHFELGVTYRDGGQLIEARESFVRAFDSLRSIPAMRDDRQFVSDLYWNIASLCYELGEYEKAAAIFEKILDYHSQDDPHYWNAMIWLGHCHKATENDAKAHECFERVLESPYASDSDKNSAREGLGRN
jgi:tetratricopeptide (TPR) repeat protein